MRATSSAAVQVSCVKCHALCAAQIRQPQQDQVDSRFAGIAKEAINGFAGGFLLVTFQAAGEEMEAHVMLDDFLDALHFIVAEVECPPTMCCDLRAFDIMVEEADAPWSHPGLCGWLLDIMVQRGEKQRGTDGTIRVQGFGKVPGELLAESSDAQRKQTCEQVICLVRAVARCECSQDTFKMGQDAQGVFPDVMDVRRGLFHAFQGGKFRQ